jgi:hypothetical protein
MNKSNPPIREEFIDLIIEAGNAVKEEWSDIQFFYYPNFPPEKRCTIFVGGLVGMSQCSITEAKQLLLRVINQQRENKLMTNFFAKVGKVQ